MKHKVKVTVIDKNYIQNYNTSIVLTQILELVLVIMSVMNLFSTVMIRGMTSGIWD